MSRSPTTVTHSPSASVANLNPAHLAAKYQYSVIIPHRDRLELLAKLLASIPARDDIEVLVIDDASDYQTQSKLTHFDSSRQHLTLVRNPADSPKGAGWARN